MVSIFDTIKRHLTTTWGKIALVLTPIVVGLWAAIAWLSNAEAVAEFFVDLIELAAKPWFLLVVVIVQLLMLFLGHRSLIAHDEKLEAERREHANQINRQLEHVTKRTNGRVSKMMKQIADTLMVTATADRLLTSVGVGPDEIARVHEEHLHMVLGAADAMERAKPAIMRRFDSWRNAVQSDDQKLQQFFGEDDLFFPCNLPAEVPVAQMQDRLTAEQCPDAEIRNAYATWKAHLVTHRRHLETVREQIQRKRAGQILSMHRAISALD